MKNPGSPALDCRRPRQPQPQPHSPATSSISPPFTPPLHCFQSSLVLPKLHPPTLPSDPLSLATANPPSLHATPAAKSRSRASWLPRFSIHPVSSLPVLLRCPVSILTTLLSVDAPWPTTAIVLPRSLRVRDVWLLPLRSNEWRGSRGWLRNHRSFRLEQFSYVLILCVASLSGAIVRSTIPHDGRTLTLSSHAFH